VLGVPGPDGAVDPVGGEDQVGGRVRGEVAHLGLELELHAEAGTPALQDVEEQLPRHPGEAVAGGGHHRPADVDVDVVPVREGPHDLVVRLGVCLGEALEGRVGEHHAETERVVGPVPLDDGDVVGGVGLLHERGEVEPGRTPADADDPQPPPPSTPAGREPGTRRGVVYHRVSRRPAPDTAGTRARVDPPSGRRLYCAP
jgi:hypothetical protein